MEAPSPKYHLIEAMSLSPSGSFIAAPKMTFWPGEAGFEEILSIET